MSTDPENIRQIDRLTRFWPLANLTADAMLAYGEAIAGKDPRDVRLAVDRLIGGRVERNHEFIPPPGQAAFQIDRARNERLDEEARQRPRLAPPPIVKHGTDEDRAGVIARLKAANGGHLIRTMAMDERAELERHRKARDAVILAAFEGDPDAVAQWRAENDALGISSPGLERNAA